MSQELTVLTISRPAPPWVTGSLTPRCLGDGDCHAASHQATGSLRPQAWCDGECESCSTVSVTQRRPRRRGVSCSVDWGDADLHAALPAGRRGVSRNVASGSVEPTNPWVPRAMWIFFINREISCLWGCKISCLSTFNAPRLLELLSCNSGLLFSEKLRTCKSLTGHFERIGTPEKLLDNRFVFRTCKLQNKCVANLC